MIARKRGNIRERTHSFDRLRRALISGGRVPVKPMALRYLEARTIIAEIITSFDQ
jgi:hypothetical protein